MRYPVRLFLGNEEVEFSTPPEILFNYSETELTNPTIIKNAYSKTVTIEGTAQNNKIFGHFYDLERIQGYDGTTVGTSFNPLVKTDFALYYNGSIYESGYFKLDEIRKNNNNIEYDISLFGGLGDWLYSLSYREDGNPMELSDLTFAFEEDMGEELGFTINKEAVSDAWNNVMTVSSKWNTINFAPCYNGIPKNDFSADKVLINNSGITDYQSTNSAYANYSIGELSEELTEWEAFDLRSYLQRPVLSVREVIKACCNPINNGGYTVNLDNSFFNTDNPYYWDAWMTLPLLTELDVPSTIQTPLTVTAFTEETQYLYNIWDNMGNASNVAVDAMIKYTPSDSYSGTSLFMLRDYYKGSERQTRSSSYSNSSQTRFAKEYAYDGAFLLQMIGYNETGQISSTSNMYYVTGSRDKGFRFKTDADYFKDKFSEIKPEASIPGVNVVTGKFTKKSDGYYLTDLQGKEYILRFQFPSDAQFTSLKLKVLPYHRDYMKVVITGESIITSQEGISLWSEWKKNSSTWQDIDTVYNLAKVEGTVSYVPYGVTGTTESFEGFWSGRQFSKKDLLTLGVTPAQFMLSYAKQFGLYFVKDVESKTVDILTRHNFYKRNEIININDLVDKGSDITITPVTAKYQYYDFGLEQVESEAAKSYSKTYGQEYGTAAVNTGLQFEQEHKKVLDSNIFKGGVDVLEKDKYFLTPMWNKGSTTPGHNGPMYVNNNFSYWYYTSGDTTVQKTADSRPFDGSIINPDGLRCYDLFPKPQFHTEGNEATDGSMVLLLYTALNYTIDGKGYHLTDDTTEMYTLNDQKPCWMMNRYTKDRAGNTVALEVASVPMFSRCIYNDETNYISHTFDMGSPLMTYVPKRYVSDWMSIYNRGWKSYISDLYSVNTRLLKCRCLLRERPNPEWMRRFYWFGNSYWRLNTIKDWNLSSFDTTEMEFIKVQDIASYDNVLFSSEPVVEIRLNTDSINETGGTIEGNVYISDGSLWTFDGSASNAVIEYSDGTTEEIYQPDIISPYQGSGAVLSPISIEIPENQSRYSRTIKFTVEYGVRNDIFYHFAITQAGNAAGSVAKISPTAITVEYDTASANVGITDVDNHGWALSTESDWVHLSQASGIGSATVALSFDANGEASIRTAQVIFSDMTSSSTTIVNITQREAPPTYEEVYVEFDAGTFVTNRHDLYKLEWKIYKGTDDTGELLNTDFIENCTVGETYYWGGDTNMDVIMNSDFDTTQEYYWELSVLDLGNHILYTDSGVESVYIPLNPDSLYYNVFLPAVEEY